MGPGSLWWLLPRSLPHHQQPLLLLTLEPGLCHQTGCVSATGYTWPPTGGQGQQPLGAWHVLRAQGQHPSLGADGVAAGGGEAGGRVPCSLTWRGTPAGHLGGGALWPTQQPHPCPEHDQEGQEGGEEGHQVLMPWLHPPRPPLHSLTLSCHPRWSRLGSLTHRCSPHKEGLESSPSRGKALAVLSSPKE